MQRELRAGASGGMTHEADMPFDVLAYGGFGAKSVTVRFDPKVRPTTPKLEQMIAETWERRLAAAARDGTRLFNGELFRYVGHETSGGTFRLTAGPTCYRDFVGTNLFNRQRLDEFGWAAFANPIGTTATLTTSDGFILYGRRSQRVAYHGGFVHTFGGALEAADRAADGTIDVFAAVQRELMEELGLTADDTGPLICRGLVRDREIHQPELLFEGTVRRTLGEMLTLYDGATARDEHVGLAVLERDPGVVLPFLSACGAIAPVAIASLMLYGRAAWGETWYEAVGKVFCACSARNGSPAT